MVEDNAKDLALHGVRGSNVDGLVKAPEHEGNGNSGVKAESNFLHRGILCNDFSVQATCGGAAAFGLSAPEKGAEPTLIYR